MYQNFKCADCGYIFEEPALYPEVNHYGDWDCPEYSCHCPSCGSEDFYETCEEVEDDE